MIALLLILPVDSCRFGESVFLQPTVGFFWNCVFDQLVIHQEANRLVEPARYGFVAQTVRNLGSGPGSVSEYR